MSVDLTTAKAHLRVSGSSSDTIITTYLNAAIAWVERFTRHKLSSGAVTETFTEFGEYLALSWQPATALTSISYKDAGGVTATVTGASLSDGRIYAPEGGWPSIQQYSPITVSYTAGHGTTPQELDQATLLLVGHFFQHRDEQAPIPEAVEFLCGPFRLPTVR